MRYLLNLSFLLICLNSFSQDVSIPDPNFLAALIALNVDTNGDGIIQISEAQARTTLNVNYRNILDLSGIEKFTNLTYLACSNNNLSTLDVTKNSLLGVLVCSYNQLCELDLSNNLELNSLLCHDNNFSELDITNNQKLDFLICYNNKLDTLKSFKTETLERLQINNNNLDHLDFTLFPNLTIVGCENNNLTNIDLSQNLKLEDFNCSNNLLDELNLLEIDSLISIYCGNNNLNSLDLSGNPKLQFLNCDSNQISSLVLTNNLELLTLNCWENKLETIDISRNLQLGSLACSQNELVELNVSNNINLSFLNCRGNELCELDVSKNPLLQEIRCYDNNLTSLDFSNNPVLSRVYIENQNIQLLNLQNGSILDSIRIDSSNLIYACIDENEFNWLSERLGNYINQVQVNTYCNFSTATANNLLTGNNGYEATGNCANASFSLSGIPFEVTDSLGVYKYWPSYELGTTYNMIFPNGDFSIKHCLDTNLFNSEPQTFDFEFDNTIDTILQEFCVSNNSPDVTNVSIALIPVEIPQAGFNIRYKIIISNLGNTSSSGIIKLNYPGTHSSIVSSSENYTLNGDTIEWTYSNLEIFNYFSIDLVLNLNSPMDNPPLNSGDILCFLGEVLPAANDINPTNNTTQVKQTIVNAFDPNDKTCLQGNFIDEDLVGGYLDYIIRFENIGNANARNVTIKDTLDSDYFDVSSFQLVDASHGLHVQQKGHAIEFIFKDINLPYLDDFNDGYVAYKIKTLEVITVGDTIKNSADIHFDFNFPIITNKTTTVVLKDDVDDDGYGFLEDCDDANPNINPGQLEILYNGFDDDCNPSTLDDDIDQDGFLLADDCDDNDDLINPDATEIPYNGIDDDCDPLTLDDDLDGDGYTINEDCDDQNPNINPDTTEIPYNGIDDDCNQFTFDDDLDQDGFLIADDCDDTNANIYPGQMEIPYNGMDDDCDAGTFDDDLDQDGFGIANDCDDNESTVYVGAPETCDGLDNNCDMEIDEGLPTMSYYLDVDLDGFGIDESIIEDCTQPNGYSLLGGDCDDQNALINPDAMEIPNSGIDENCDGILLSLDPYTDFGLEIYPNPINDVLYLKQTN